MLPHATLRKHFYIEIDFKGFFCSTQCICRDDPFPIFFWSRIQCIFMSPIDPPLVQVIVGSDTWKIFVAFRATTYRELGCSPSLQRTSYTCWQTIINYLFQTRKELLRCLLFEYALLTTSKRYSWKVAIFYLVTYNYAGVSKRTNLFSRCENRNNLKALQSQHSSKPKWVNDAVPLCVTIRHMFLKQWQKSVIS